MLKNDCLAIIRPLIKELDRVTSFHDLKALIEPILSKINFNNFAYISLNFSYEKSKIVMTNYPVEWEFFYKKNNYHRIDPIILEFNKINVPHRWIEVVNPNNLEDDQRKLFLEGKEYGVNYDFNSNISCPLHGPSGSFALMSFLPSSEKINITSISNAKYSLQLLAQIVHLKINDFIPKKKKNYYKKSELSAREIECLFWAALGKSAWETAKILNITENTVKKHLNNAISKLDCQSKTQAITKALLINEISLLNLSMFC